MLGLASPKNTPFNAILPEAVTKQRKTAELGACFGSKKKLLGFDCAWLGHYYFEKYRFQHLKD